MTAAERAAGCYMRAPDHDGGEGGAAAGGAAASLDGAAAALAGADAGGDAAAAAAAAAAAGGEAERKWLEQFSAEGGDADNPSNRDWLNAKGFKTADDVVASYRAAEKAIHDKGGIKVPGEDAKPEEIAAFNKAIGVPDKVEDYKITLPDGIKEEELDMELLGSLKADALKSGMPAKAFDGIIGAYITKQMDALQSSATAENGSRDQLFSEWGDQKTAKLADVNNAMRSLGLTAVDVAAMQRGFAMQYGEPGSKRTLELLQKLGAGMAEDVLLNPEQTSRRFGITGAEAQKEVDKLVGDREFGEKLARKEPEAVSRWDRLNAAIAADRDRAASRAAAG